MIETQKSIYEFHKKHQFSYSLALKANKRVSKIIMFILCKATRFISKLCFKYSRFVKNDINTMESFYRFHLMLEELAELMLHINKGELEGTCDGLGDLIYVVIGTAVSYHLPAKEIIEEVCRSNDTKAPRDPKNNARLRNKGDNYSPPNFNKVIWEGEKRLYHEGQI